MTPAVRERVEAAILRALAPGPLSGEALAAALRADSGCLDGAMWWTRAITALQQAGRVERVGAGRAVMWAVTRPAGGRRRQTAGAAA